MTRWRVIDTTRERETPDDDDVVVGDDNGAAAGARNVGPRNASSNGRDIDFACGRTYAKRVAR